MHDSYPKDIPQEPPYDETSLERVETIEALPHDEAFEQLMYEHRARRQAHHLMDTPLSVPDHLLDTGLPEEIRTCLPSKHVVIEQLDITQTEYPDTPTLLEIHFTNNDLQHRLTSRDEHTSYCVENMNGDTHEYELDSDISTPLLGALLYARINETTQPSFDGDSPITFPTSQRTLPRAPIVSEREVFIAALGDLDGMSSILTTATFHTEDKVIAATLTEIEKPMLSGLQSRLELDQIQDMTDLSALFDEQISRTDLHQNFSNTDLLGTQTQQALRYAEQHLKDRSYYIDPQEDFSEWATVCDSFLTVVEDELRQLDR